MAFHRNLHYTGEALPPGIRVINPFSSSSGGAQKYLQYFADRYLHDTRSRHLILGINPSRFGAAVTGVPFTDTKRLVSECGIPYQGQSTHEISSVFIYEMISAYGGVEKFYNNFYINSPFPLALTKVGDDGKEKNYNYYDSPAVLAAVRGFMAESLQRLIDLGVYRGTCFCLGTGKNARFLQQMNEAHQFFEKIIPLEHPRFIMQYKSASKERYIDKYLAALTSVTTHDAG